MPSYWCHGCGGEASVREEGGSLVCVACSGCFVEVCSADDDPREFHVPQTAPASAPAPPAAAPAPAPFYSAVHPQAVPLPGHAYPAGHVHAHQQGLRPHVTTHVQSHGPANMMTQVMITPLVVNPGASNGFANIARTMEQMLGDAVPPFPGVAGAGTQSHGRWEDLLHRILVEHEPSGNPPAASAAVQSLPAFQADSAFCEREEDPCIICQEEYAVDDNCQTMPCSHTFHRDCLGQWLKTSNVCPVCRHELPTDDAEYDSRREAQQGGGPPPVAT
eukprot:TRINITY_DN2164_c0_g1_i1.p1 TRINITY_DN2164_c0_g1~~TRINITY_DN2164_c0_g1_i1.p1  ORF type:complete len:275 (+),score=57.27 TRINITY_DN2164_c0_g1_i1:276-1100(+)